MADGLGSPLPHNGGKLQDDAVKRLLRGGLLTLLLLAAPSVALAASPTSSPKLTGAGTVTGTLTPKSLLTVKLHVEHSQGWQHIQVIDVLLELRGSTIDQIEITPTTSSVQILGGSAPASLGQAAELQGAYFRVNPAQVAFSARGKQLLVTLPLHLGAAPPPGARLAFSATAVPVATLGPKSLTPPVKSNSGFSWGTLGLAIAVALFAGGFAGSIFAGRRRPAPRPSIYAAVERRLAEERAKK
jgi:hypothetical protein